MTKSIPINHELCGRVQNCGRVVKILGDSVRRNETTYDDHFYNRHDSDATGLNERGNKNEEIAPHEVNRQRLMA